MQQLDAQEAPYSRVNSIAQAAQDPHFIARKALIDLPDADLGSVKAPCIVPRFVGKELPIPHTGPHRGEHNENFYASMNLSENELALLKTNKVI